MSADPEPEPERAGARAWLVVYLKGVFMGAADAVPGVSGGTIALITGIYERLIHAITGLDLRALGDLRRVRRPAGRAALRDSFRRMDLAFLFVLGAGVLTALVTVARIMDVALVAYPALTFAFFFGLIAASAAVLYGHVALDSPRRIAVAIAGFALAFVVSAPDVNGAFPHSSAFVLFAGAVAIAGMILPGISGAFFLLLLGQYDYLTTVLSEFTDALAGLAGGGSAAALVGPGTTIAAFGTGALVGLFSIAYAIRWALATYRAATLTFLVSLMVGALRLPAQKVLEHTPRTAAGAGAVLAVALASGALVLLVDRYTEDVEFAGASDGRESGKRSHSP
jgi:putative membrane protein